MQAKKTLPRWPAIRSKLFRDAGERRLGVTAAFNGDRFSGSVPVARDATADRHDIATLLERIAAFVRTGKR